MKRSLFILIALCAFTLHASAQVMDWYTYWGSNQAGSQIQPVRMVVDNDGFVYTASLFGGSTVSILDEVVPSLSGVDKGDAVITKMTADKVSVWKRAMVGSGTATVSDIVIDNDGNLVAIGTFTGTLQPDATNSMTMQDPSGYAALAIYVVRFDPNGNVLNMWQLPAEEATVNNVSVDGNNNIIVSGTFGSEISFDPANLSAFVGSTQYFNQMFVAKYTPAGALVWAKYKQDATASYTNAFSKADVDGNIFVSGAFTGSVTLAGTAMETGTAVSDVFLVKMSSVGDETWSKHIKGSRNERAIAVEVSPIGDVAVLTNYHSEDITVTGVVDTLHNGFRNLTGTANQYHMGIFTFKKDNGDYRWWYSYGVGSTVGGGGGIGYTIRSSDEGVWYIGGSTSGRMGDINTFDHFGNANSGLKTVDGVWMQHNTNGGADAIYLVLTREGELGSIARPGGPQTEILQDIALSPDKKNVYFLMDIKGRAAVMYTCVDNMFDSFLDLYTNFPRADKYTLIQVLSPETPVNNAYTTASVGFNSAIVSKYKLPEITPETLPTYTSGEEYNQALAINLPAGVPQFYQLAIPDELNFIDHTLIGTITGGDALYLGVLAIDSTANPGEITYYAQDPNKVSIRGTSRNIRYLSLLPKDETSVKIVKEANASFFPTVCVDVLNVKTSETNYLVQVFSQTGQLIGQHNNPTSIKVDKLPAGIYFARLITNSGAVNTAKFIIE